MKRIARRAVAGVLLLGACACSSSLPENPEDGPWVGTRETEADVTTVVNQSGSVWEGEATLVEEASIGVASGAPEYMFGQIDSIFADGERIYVVDFQARAVRTYGYDGTWLGDVGRAGEGPGEFTDPRLVTVDADGRIFVVAARAQRANVHDGDGTFIGGWPIPDYECCYIPVHSIGPDRLQVPVRRSYPDMRRGLQVHGPEGPVGEPRWIPEVDLPRRTAGAGDRGATGRFAPHRAFAPLPAGGVVVGATHEYRFEIRPLEGDRVVVRRDGWEPVPVRPEEAEWYRRLHVALGRVAGGVPADADGEGLPAHKPVYDAFVPSTTGEIWVAREGVSRRIPDCDEDPRELGPEVMNTRWCWRGDWFFDVFDVDGRYLGPVTPLPDTPIRRFQRRVFVAGDTVLAATEDDAGTFRVKRYRLVLPGGR